MFRTVIAWGLLFVALGCGGAPAAGAASGESSRAGGEPSDESAAADPEGSTSSPEGEGVTFRVKVPRAGAVRIVDSRQSSKLRLSQRRGKRTEKLVQATTKHTRTRTTVLAADGEAITKKRVEYLEGSSEQRIGDRAQQMPNPLIGKTYVLELKGGRLRATGKRGRPISDYEREQLVRDNPNFGKPSAFAKLLPERSIRVGERLTPDPELLAEAFGKRDVAVRRASFVLREVTESQGETHGSFDVKLTLVETTDQGIIETTLAGSVVLQASTCWPVEIDLEGTVRLEGKPPNRSRLSGTGEVSMRVSSRYE